ncbi:hypothetical protein AURDEDRAFT_23913, partial [Auricularia subglabra TFB-10046 SS5]
GIGLHKIKQKTALQAIRLSQRRVLPERRATSANIARIKAEIKLRCDYTPTTEQIWRGIRSPAFSRQTRNFLWKAVHGAHKIGSYFAKMPEPWKSMAKCPTCEVEESLEHILLECPDSRQEVVWELVKELFRQRRITAGVSYGSILGCANVHLEGFGSNRDSPAERAYRMTVAESSFFIWKLRCEKRIEHQDEPDWQLTNREVSERWLKMIRTRMKQDSELAKSKKYPTRSGQRWLTWATW